jgi:hypothetical protein
MTASRRAVVAVCLLAPVAGLAQVLREVHGAHDAWAEPGLALAWGVLRGRSETDTRVLLRIEADPQRHGRVTALGRDPFGGSTVELPLAMAADGSAQLNLPRSHFAEHPRTELRFFAPGRSQPQLLVFYLGLPDTTPEFVTAGQLDADLQARLSRARTRQP